MKIISEDSPFTMCSCVVPPALLTHASSSCATLLQRVAFWRACSQINIGHPTLASCADPLHDQLLAWTGTYATLRQGCRLRAYAASSEIFWSARDSTCTACLHSGTLVPELRWCTLYVACDQSRDRGKTALKPCMVVCC